MFVTSEASGALGLAGIEGFDARRSRSGWEDCAEAGAAETMCPRAKPKSRERTRVNEIEPRRRKFFSVGRSFTDANRAQIEAPVTSGQCQAAGTPFPFRRAKKLPGCANYFSLHDFAGRSKCLSFVAMGI